MLILFPGGGIILRIRFKFFSLMLIFLVPSIYCFLFPPMLSASFGVKFWSDLLIEGLTL